MRPNSPVRGDIAAHVQLRRICALCLSAHLLTGAAAAQTAIGIPNPAAAANTARPVNGSGHAIILTVPVMDASANLGDILLSVDASDRMTVSSGRLLALLSTVLKPDATEQLRQALATVPAIGPDDLTPLHYAMHYNPQTIALELTIPTAMRAARAIQLAPDDSRILGNFETPAQFSAYLNLRGSIDYVDEGAQPGLGTPALFFDGATRYRGVVLESQATWQPGVVGPDFQRRGTRLVYDDLPDLTRWTVGDLQTIARGFQSAPDIAGISLLRSYSALQPQSVARPTGLQSFSLERPSTVEVLVNGRLARRLRLDPGAYDLRDFPFVEGANDIRLNILDDAGRTQALDFNFFADSSQLAEGLSEFGYYAGIAAPPGIGGPQYSSDWRMTGFYRRGISNRLTLGANFQADRRTQMTGLEATFATPIGVFGSDLAASHSGDAGALASRLTYQGQWQHQDGTADMLNLSASLWSGRFSAVATITPDTPYSSELAAAYSHTFSPDFYAGIDLHYARARQPGADFFTNRINVGWRVTQSLALTADLLYQRDAGAGRDEAAFLLSVKMRLDPDSSARADVDSRDRMARLSYQMTHGEGAGAYNLAADAERTDTHTGFSGSADYSASMAELSADHTHSLGVNGAMPDSRTALHIGTSLAFADGAISMGRPINDSFAIVSRHKSLGDAPVLLDPSPYGYTASTGVLGTATEPAMASYSEKTILIDAPDAPPGFDLGSGSFRLFPPYRSGYRLQVGSDYSVTVVGRLLDEAGAPLPLAAGTATELAQPQHAPIALFSNRDGRFGLAGVKPGRWRIAMSSNPARAYDLIVPADAVGAWKAGDLAPSQSGEQP